MGEAVYNRAMVREKTIWPSFLYGMPGIESTKTMIFGLYANTYLLGHNYLEDIEDEELQRLIDVYDSNMAELSMEEQGLVLEIASKKYVKTIEIQIKNNALVTKGQQLNADEQEYEAKLAALEVDRDALETKQAQITLAIDRAENKNKILVSKINLEGLAQQYVDVEIAQKELEAGKAVLKLLYAELRGTEIQLDIANVSLQISEAEASKSGIDVDIANYKARTAITNLVSDRLSVATAEASAVAKEVTLYSQRRSLVDARGTVVSNETSDINSLTGLESSLEAAQKSEQTARHQAITQGYTDSTILSTGRTTIAASKSSSDIAIGTERMASQITIGTTRATMPPTRCRAASTTATAAIDAAEILATADITTSLTHEIGSA
jgi:hypothetical protein